MLTIQGCTSIIFGGNDTRDCRQLVFAECVILVAKKTLSPPVRLPLIDPILHDPSTYERRNLDRFVPSMQQQPVAVVRTFIGGQLSDGIGVSFLVIDYGIGALRQRRASREARLRWDGAIKT